MIIPGNRTRDKSIQKRVLAPYCRALAKSGSRGLVELRKGRIYINGTPYRIGDVTRMRRELEARIR